MQQQLVNRSVLVLVLLAISALFLALVKPFLVGIFLAALFAALFYPLYDKLRAWTGEREALASGLTLIIVFCFLFIPLALLSMAVISQAVEVSALARPWFVEQFSSSGELLSSLKSFPLYEQIQPYQDQVIKQVSDFFAGLSKVTLDFLQSATFGTLNTLWMAFVVIYSMFFFLIDGDRLLYYILYYLPLSDEEEHQLLNRFTSVARATIKGTAVIGLLQGTLNGLAFYLVGIPSALLWAVAMVFLSVVPGIGTAAVWVPAVVFLLLSGKTVTGLGLAAFCGLVVGSIDNVLRPKLVGSDTQMHELLIFFSTMGGFVMFGFWGFVIGPIIAALFVTIWTLYGDEFNEWLPTTAYTPRNTYSLQGRLPDNNLRGGPSWQHRDQVGSDETVAADRTVVDAGELPEVDSDDKPAKGAGRDNPRA